MTGNSNPFGEIIDSYSRVDALADGTLVSADPKLLKEVGIKFSLAYTRAVAEDCVEWTAEDEENTNGCQDRAGREWDVLYMTAHAMRCSATPSRRLGVELFRVPRDGGRDCQAALVSLILTIGPDDEGNPCLTLLMPDED